MGWCSRCFIYEKVERKRESFRYWVNVYHFPFVQKKDHEPVLGKADFQLILWTLVFEPS